MNKERFKEFAYELYAIDSPSGYTKKAIEFLENKAKSLGFETSRNQKGNLHVFVPGKDHSYKVGVSAHTDTLGLMVRSINGDGTLRFTNIGGPILPTLDGEYCRIITREGKVYTGTILSTSPAVHVFKDASTAPRNADTMIVKIDEIVKSKDDVLKLGIMNGDIIAIDPKTTFTESGFIKSRFLDDKISVCTLFEILNMIHDDKIELAHDTYFIVTTYEEVGHGAANLPEIDELLACDMGCIGQDLTCTEYDVSICAKDSTGPYDYEMVSKLIELAKREECQYAVDIYPFYGSDVGAALGAGHNIKGALIGPGVAASHGMERTHMQAIESTVKLLLAYIQA